jgi:hypothetical protein
MDIARTNGEAQFPLKYQSGYWEMGFLFTTRLCYEADHSTDTRLRLVWPGKRPC